MYDIIVPIGNGTFRRAGKEKIVEKLKAMGVKRVLFGLNIPDGKEKDIFFRQLKENVAYLKAQGFEVGAWRWTFWLQGKNNHTHIRFTDGKDSEEYICPSDAAYRASVAEYLKELARCGVDMILFDDDYRFGFLTKAPGCVCENHVAYMEQLLGEKLPENFCCQLVCGGENKYRSAWIRANRHFMLQFAGEMRAAVDEVDPKLRMGVCGCMSVWDIDGATPLEISKALAGNNTRPYLRLIGAPYWAVKMDWGNRLQDVVELERMQLAWCRGEDVEIVGEGDVYPRPRIKCPASYLELFDTALRADGGADGLMKYVLDYESGADYETGYVEKHLRSTELCRGIEEMFGPKESVGVRVWERMRKAEHMDIPEGYPIENTFFSVGARMLACNAISSVYTGSGICGVAFGDNVKYLPPEAFEKGLILDIRAARNLMDMGVDVGIAELSDTLGITGEHYLVQDEHVHYANAFTGRMPKAARIRVRDGAAVQSEYYAGQERLVGSFTYENEAGQRFLVLNLDSCFPFEDTYRHYIRQHQLVSGIEWLSGEKLPAKILKNPDLYMQCKRKDGALAVGLWNMFADSVDEPVITMDKAYSRVKGLNCSAELAGDRVKLSQIPAFGFAAFEVE